jgi:LuxR family quorum-sensing system transcriptional regulator CciR
VSASHNLASRAFDVLASMRQAASEQELNALARDVFATLGLEWFSLARFFARDGSPETKVLHGEFEPRWSEHYVRQNYAKSSLIARQLLHRSDSYSWKDVLAHSTDPIQDRIFHEAREHGLRNGLFTPVRLSDGSFGAVVTAGLHAELEDPLYRSMAEVLSTFYAYECRRIAAALPNTTKLSSRQRDCLAWVRHGKSSTDIAQLLGISAQTVDEHINEACRKFGVRTRVQAAVEATLLGVI